MKKIIITITSSILIIILFMWRLNEFVINKQNTSDVLFFVSFMYFFPGLISVTRAGKVFDGAKYASKKMFKSHKSSEEIPKTFSEYLDQKEEREGRGSGEFFDLGMIALILGSVYFIASLTIANWA